MSILPSISPLITADASCPRLCPGTQSGSVEVWERGCCWLSLGIFQQLTKTIHSHNLLFLAVSCSRSKILYFQSGYICCSNYMFTKAIAFVFFMSNCAFFLAIYASILIIFVNKLNCLAQLSHDFKIFLLH